MTQSGRKAIVPSHAEVLAAREFAVYGARVSWTGNSLMSGGPCGVTPAAAIPSPIRPRGCWS